MVLIWGGDPDITRPLFAATVSPLPRRQSEATAMRESENFRISFLHRKSHHVNEQLRQSVPAEIPESRFHLFIHLRFKFPQVPESGALPADIALPPATLARVYATAGATAAASQGGAPCAKMSTLRTTPRPSGRPATAFQTSTSDHGARPLHLPSA